MMQPPQPAPAVPELDSIFLGDCAELLRRLPDSCVDLVVSSPPYNIGKTYETRRALDSYLAEQREILAECVRVLKPTGSLVWQVGAYSLDGSLIPLDVRFFPILEDLGLIPRNRIIWLRRHGLHGRRKFSARHETILWFTMSDEYKFNLDAIRVPQKYPNKKHYRGERKGELSGNELGKNPGDIWAFQNVKHNHEEQTIHPAQFPEDLITRIVLAMTDEGEVVLDPYMGTGTTAVVASELGRHFLGAELDPTYHEIAERRLDGNPRPDSSFPNLKTLRAYAARTGTPTSDYSFDVQVGATPSLASRKAAEYEQDGLAAVETRISYEEDSFTARIRGEEAPQPSTSSERRAEAQAAALRTQLRLE